MARLPGGKKSGSARNTAWTRRRFLRAGGAAGAAMWLGGAARASSLRSWPVASAESTALAGLAGFALEAYAGATSVKRGGAIGFFVRDPQGSKRDRSVPIAFVRIDAADQTMLTGTVNVRGRSVPSNASTAGCGWPVSFTLTVPAGWPSGLYHAVIGAGTQACFVPFVVRPAVRAAGVNVLVQIAVTTAQAYNNYGGKSLYAFNSTAGVAATKVSFDRPHADPTNFAFDGWQAPFVRWLATHGIAADFCTSVDLHADAAALTGYRLFLTAGHDEYWSRPMRDRLDSMVAAGGNAAIFSGNTCWWQVRFESGSTGAANRTMVCYKSSTADPDTRAAYKTVNWIDLVPPYPENSTIGLGWKLGCSWTSAYPRPDTPYVLQRAEHWAFEGTGLTPNGTFAGQYVGYEADSLQFTRGTDGRAYPTGADGAPSTLRVLAVADASRWNEQNIALGGGGEKSGTALISIHSRGGAAGAVFNAATIDWALGLQDELYGQAGPLTRITRNVITTLSARHQESADVRRWRTAQINGDGTRDYYTIGTDVPAGATLGGLAFRAYVAPVAGSVPIYRYRAAQANGDGVRYFYDQSSTIGLGWTLEGVAFHAFAGDLLGRAAVFQHHIDQANGDGRRFLYSPNLVEPGWVFDGVSFFGPVS